MIFCPPPFSKIIFFPLSTVKIFPFPPFFHLFPFNLVFFLDKSSYFFPNQSITQNEKYTPLQTTLRPVPQIRIGFGEKFDGWMAIIFADKDPDPSQTQEFLLKNSKEMLCDFCLPFSKEYSLSFDCCKYK